MIYTTHRFPKSLLPFLLISAACVTTAALNNFYPNPDGRTRAEFSASGTSSAVATAHPLASQAAMAMLEQGGNAVDAAVAASFVISVVRPQSSGIGGGGFMLVHNKQQRRTDVYDFRERAPIGAHRDMYVNSEGEPSDFIYRGIRIPNASLNGHLAVGVPGLVAGLADVHRATGRLPWSEVVRPAIEAAERGFTVYPQLAEAIQRRQEILRHFSATRNLFLPNGEPLKAGATLRQENLAKTLRAVARNGKAGFYQGWVAQQIVATMQEGGGLITQSDLDQYQMKKRQPIVGRYREHVIVSMPPPSSGGVHIVQMLNMLSHFEHRAGTFQTPQRLHVLTEVMRRAFADRATYLGDPDFVDVPAEGLVSPRYAAELVKSIRMKNATPSAQVGPGQPFHYQESPSTTHISVVDPWGNAVSTTQTVNYTFGSGVVAEGTGIVLNNEMDDFSKKPGVPNVFGLVGSEANAVASRKTMLSSMSPTFVFDPTGRLELVVGSPGGPRIITATLQTILNIVDYDMKLDDAVHAFRIHHQWQPDKLFIEAGGYSQELVETLEEYGHSVVQKDSSFGDVQAIHWENGKWVAVSDTRSDGTPMAR